MVVVVGEEQVHQGYQEDRVGPRDQEVQLLPWGQVGRLDRGVPSYQRVQEVRVSRALVVVVVAVVGEGVGVGVVDSTRRRMMVHKMLDNQGDRGWHSF